MRSFVLKNIYLTALSAILLLSGCKKWEDHISVDNKNLQGSVMDLLKGDPNLSVFTAYLTQTGLDKVLSSSLDFTVFAPVNGSFVNLDQTILSDTAKLAKFLRGHIALQSYYIKDMAVAQRIKLLNGKYATIFNSSIDDASIVGADRYAQNGVVQVIGKSLPYLQNIWETVIADASLPAKQRAYLLSLNKNYYDISNAVQIGVNATTGLPIYQPGTDSVASNIFLRSVYDLKDETKQYTLYMLPDTTWDKEFNKFKVYYATSSVDSTATACNWDIAKDLAISGLQTATAPDTVLSKFNVKVPFTKSAIARTIKTSNGVIYIMSKVDVLPKEKIKQFVIEGESYRYQCGPTGNIIDKRGNTYFRDRINTLTGKPFMDVLVYNHGTAQLALNYRISNAYSARYKVYWVAYNDFVSPTAFSQLVAIGTPTTTTTLLPYFSVPANNLAEVYVGEFTLTNYRPTLDVFLTAANTTVAATNAIICDYFRLEPVVQ